MERNNPYEIQKGKQVSADLASVIFSFVIFLIVALIFLDLSSNFVLAYFPFILIPAFFFFVLIFAIVFLFNYLSLVFLSYSLGERDFVLRGGIIARFEKVLPYSKIQHVILTQTFFQRVFGVTTVSIQTARPEGYVANYRQNISYGSAIPGLLKKDAEQLRNFIISEILKRKKEKDI
jgi:membrane protein YdbS with pleckstrin-like domain